MNNYLYTPKVPKLVLFIAVLLFLFALEGLYLSCFKGLNEEMLKKKKEFVGIVKLPDLAISTEATYIRHRSMSDIFSIYKDDGSLREYFPSTYTYSHSHIINGVKNER